MRVMHMHISLWILLVSLFVCFFFLFSLFCFVWLISTCMLPPIRFPVMNATPRLFQKASGMLIKEQIWNYFPAHLIIVLIVGLKDNFTIRSSIQGRMDERTAMTLCINRTLQTSQSMLIVSDSWPNRAIYHVPPPSSRFGTPRTWP